MNSAMQCIANSPYIREFFTGVSNNPEFAISDEFEHLNGEAGDKKHPLYKY